MVFKIHLGHLRLDVLPGPLGPEAVILLGELGILDFLLDHVHAAQPDAQELDHDVGVGVTEGLVAHEGEREDRVHVAGLIDELVAAFHADVEPHGPDAREVADARVKGSQHLRRVHVLHDHVLFREAEGLQVFGHAEVLRGGLGIEEGLALHGFGRAEEVRILGVPALHLEGGIVGPHRDGVDPRFVVGDADEVGIVAERAHEDGDRARAAHDPLLGGEGFKLIHAGLEEMDLEIQPLVLIPSLFLGIPEDE